MLCTENFFQKFFLKALDKLLFADYCKEEYVRHNYLTGAENV